MELLIRDETSLKQNISFKDGVHQYGELNLKETVGDLETKIQEINQILPTDQRLIHEGMELDDPNSLLTDYNMGLHSRGSRRAIIYLLPQPEKYIIGLGEGRLASMILMDICIQTVTKKIIRLVNIHKTISIVKIKQELEKQIGISYKMQHLFFVGKRVHDERKLCDYQAIKHGDTLRLYIVPQASQNLLSRDTRVLAIHTGSRNGPDYLVYRPGVSSVGICSKSLCQIYKNTFICNHGFGLYHPYLDPTFCPSCNSRSTEVRTFGFCEAKITIRVKEVSRKQVETFTYTSPTVGHYTELPEQMLKTNSVKFEFIEVFSWPISKSSKAVTGLYKHAYKLCNGCKRSVLPNGPKCDHGLAVAQASLDALLAEAKDSSAETKL